MKTEALDNLLCLLDVRLNAIGLCEVAHGWRLALPRPDGLMVHYILEGSGVMRCADDSVVPFRPNSLIFLHSSCGAHEIAATGEEDAVADWKGISQPLGEGMMQFRAGDGPTAIISACAMVSADCGGLDIFEQLREPVAETLEPDSAVQAAFALMLDELRQPRLGTRALSEALMKQCLILALRSQFERGEVTLMSLPALRDMRLLKALLKMVENPGQEHSLEELARISGMSRSLFADRFAQTFKRPPMDLLKQIRLHRAANLLRSSQLPVQIVAMTVGYASRSYFSRAFRSAYGTDPKTFRQEARRLRNNYSREKENA
ncbi:MAG: helix-turn-helix domain-containing protein [Pseudomonadota bacterium]|nr:helix-turn-helix domain-containing protein [Pseudomonadota bacterium]